MIEAVAYYTTTISLGLILSGCVVVLAFCWRLGLWLGGRINHAIGRAMAALGQHRQG